MPLPTAEEASPRRLLRDEVYTTLHDAIIDGTLEPGEVLRDDELIAWLGVSRTPIRQALNKLNDIGLVEMVPGRFTKVAEFDAALINHATYATGILHQYSARRSVPNLTPSQLDEMSAHLDDATRAARVGDLTVLGPAIRDFFRVFHKAAGNEVIYDAVEQSTPLLLRFLTPREELMPTSDILSALDSILSSARDHDEVATVEKIHALYEPTRREYAAKYRSA